MRRVFKKSKGVRSEKGRQKVMLHVTFKMKTDRYGEEADKIEKEILQETSGKVKSWKVNIHVDNSRRK